MHNLIIESTPLGIALEYSQTPKPENHGYPMSFISQEEHDSGVYEWRKSKRTVLFQDQEASRKEARILYGYKFGVFTSSEFNEALTVGIPCDALLDRIEIKQESYDPPGYFSDRMHYRDVAILLPCIKEEAPNFPPFIALPKMIIEHPQDGLPFGEQYYLAYLEGTAIVVQAETEEQAIDELMTSIRVQLLHDYNNSK